MLIGIDASRSTRADVTGTEQYSRRVLQEIIRQRSEDVDLRLYLNQKDAPQEFAGEGIDVRAIPQRRLWTHLRLRRELKEHPVDRLFVPAHTLPARCPVPAVVTVHDLGYLHEPGAHPRLQRLYLDRTTKWSVHQAERVIAISRHTRDDLVSAYNVDPGKITVIYHGVDDRFRTTGNESLPVNDELPPYVLYLGTIQPRKNLVRLIEAFETVATTNRDVELVLAGKRGWMSQPIIKRAKESAVADRIRMPGHVPDDILPDVYRRAAAFVLPSLYEGFGLPVLEAMASGVPVVASKAGSLPEISGDAAILVDPLQVDEIATGIRTAVCSERRKRLIRAGLRWSSLFTWEQCGQETLDVITSRDSS